jgi:drug/metabolite transporter (DMT)-like permease
MKRSVKRLVLGVWLLFLTVGGLLMWPSATEPWHEGVPDRMDGRAGLAIVAFLALATGAVLLARGARREYRRELRKST